MTQRFQSRQQNPDRMGKTSAKTLQIILRPNVHEHKYWNDYVAATSSSATATSSSSSILNAAVDTKGRIVTSQPSRHEPHMDMAVIF